MIRFSSLMYLFKQGVSNIWRNRLMSLASIGVLISCMLLIGSALLISANISSFVGYVEDQSEAVIFLDDDLDDVKIADIENRIRETGNILSLTFISKEQGLQEMMESLGDDGILFEAYGDEAGNNLPDSFRITIDDLSKLDNTISQLKSIEGVYSISAPTDIVGTITGIKNMVYIGGLVVVGILAAVSVMIIGNTIKITVFSRRKEINIMKYVGATDSFIRFPYIVEGLLLGLISASIAYFLLWYGYDYFVFWMQANPASWLPALNSNLVSFSSVARALLLGFLGGGTGIGILGSAIFLNRHLKV